MTTIFHFLNGAIASIIYFLNTIFWFVPIMLCSLIKLIPYKPLAKHMSIIADECATLWISVNKLNQLIFSRTTFTVQMPSDLSLDKWYLVIANHQSWVDILVLQRVFNRKIPFLKFFLKQNLIFVPFIGLVWWGLDFPFMKRYSKAFLAKNPHLKGKDLETTKKACEKFEHIPVSVMNFVEGTRFNKQKSQAKSNKELGFNRVLAPKSGGIAFVLNAMDSQLNSLVDVTIFYPGGIPSFGDFVSGKVNEVIVKVDTTSIDSLFTSGVYSSDYFTDDKQKKVFQDYLNQLWHKKQEYLICLEKEHNTQ